MSPPLHGTSSLTISYLPIPPQWLDVLKRFCNAELSVKTKPYYCCKRKGDVRQRCFQHAAPYPNYKFKGAGGGANLLGNQKLPEISFPPGRPTSSNIENVCTLRKFRPVYPAGVIPRTGFGWFQRQARALNRLENMYKKCCHTQDVGCARRGVSESRRLVGADSGEPTAFRRVAPSFRCSVCRLLSASRRICALHDGEIVPCEHPVWNFGTESGAALLLPEASLITRQSSNVSWCCGDENLLWFT